MTVKTAESFLSSTTYIDNNNLEYISTSYFYISLYDDALRESSLVTLQQNAQH